MAGFVMNNFSYFAAAFLALAACSPHTPVEEPPLAGARIGGPFSLVNQDGKAVTEADLKGKYSLVYFGYTYCPDVCPVDLQYLMNGYRQFEKAEPAEAAKVQPVFITVDPARDTPENIKKFVGQFHPKLMGLTGSEQNIAAVAKKYAVAYSKVKGSTPDDYLMSHLQIAYLMGPDGKPIALIPVDDISTPVNEGEPQKVADELARWVR